MCTLPAPKILILSTAVLVSIIHGTASLVSAGDLDDVKQRLLAARKHNEMDRIYRDITRELKGDVRKTVGFLRNNGFSCWTNNGYFKARCVLAYCGDRSAFIGFRKELMTIGVTITERGVNTSVVHQPSACPRTEAALQGTQERLLTGGKMHGGK